MTQHRPKLTHQTARRKRSELDLEEILADTLSCKVTHIGNVGRSYIKREPGAEEGYIYRLDLFDKEQGGWYHSEWYNPAGDPIRTEYYED